jgi:GH25 family lysozyme M1 (1,4-beta-N-acetylmuramidase)
MQLGEIKMYKKLGSIVLVFCMVLTLITVPARAADSGDKAMGDSYVGTDEDTETGITTFSIPKAPSGTIAKGVDISHWDGSVNFKKLAKEVDFVIIRCGYGSNTTSQDDRKFETYVKGCRDNNIPYGVYLYAHAKTVSAGKSEGKHALRQLKKLAGWKTEVSLPIFYDMEDNDQLKLSASKKASIAKAFCKVLEDAGYKTGIYANLNWWNNYLTNSYFNNKIKWVAQYNSKCTYKKKYAMWQCSESAKVSGISVKADYNYMIQDIFVNVLKVTGYSGTYDGQAHSITIKNGKDISYSLDQINWTTQKPTRTNVGTTTVYYKATNSAGEEITGSEDIVIAQCKVSSCKISYSTKAVYSGTQITPGVKITYNGHTLSESMGYTVTYGENTDYGQGIITISGTGNLTGSVTKTFDIVTATPKLTSAVKSKTKITVKWNAVSDTDGYQIAYKKSGSSSWKYKTVTATKKTLTGLSKNKKYTVKVRAYKSIGGKKYYTAYSASKTTKKK